jgi:hypothetical protein
MAIVNRDLDVTQQRYVFTVNPNSYGVSTFGLTLAAASTGVSQIITLGIMPCASQLLQVATAAWGVSGTPTVGVQIQRFVVGSGLTTIAFNSLSLLTVTAYATSGMQLQTLPAAGASGYGLLKGDVLQAVTSTANSAAVYSVEAVVQILQDVKSDYGV